MNLTFWSVSLEDIQEIRQTHTPQHIISLHPCFYPCEAAKSSNYCKCCSDRESREKARRRIKETREIAAVAAGAKRCSLSQPHPQLTHTLHHNTHCDTLTHMYTGLSHATHCCSNHFEGLNATSRFVFKIMQILGRLSNNLVLISCAYSSQFHYLSLAISPCFLLF